VTAADRAVVVAQAELLQAAVEVDAEPALAPTYLSSLAPELALLDPYLAATHQETCTEALAAGSPGRLYAAVLRAGAQHAQLDLSGVRPT